MVGFLGFWKSTVAFSKRALGERDVPKTVVRHNCNWHTKLVKWGIYPLPTARFLRFNDALAVFARSRSAVFADSLVVPSFYPAFEKHFSLGA
jgi:hypothetical protein